MQSNEITIAAKEHYPVFSYYNSFTGNVDGNPYLLYPANGGLYYENSAGENCAFAADESLRKPISKSTLGDERLNKLLSRLGLHEVKNEIISRDGENIILPFYLGKHSGEFVLTQVSDEGVIGLASQLQNLPVFVSFNPTDEELEPSLPEMIYEHSNEGTLYQFLDYHFDYSPVTYQRFFEYLSGYVKRKLTLERVGELYLAERQIRCSII